MLTSTMRSWTLWVPALAVVALALTWGRDLPSLVSVLVVVVLIGSVLAAVQHAEVIAHRVGEPAGSLVLAVAVTIIEVGMIVMLMTGGGEGAETLARDTVFAALMITCNGIVGLVLLVGALRRGVAVFNSEGTGAALATVATLATLSLVLPDFTTSKFGPEFTGGQLAFAGAASLVLYVLFILVQTLRHPSDFLPVESAGRALQPVGAAGAASGDIPAPRSADGAGETGDGGAVGAADGTGPEPRLSVSLILLVVSLVCVVGLAKVVTPALERGVAAAGLPFSVVGVVIALLVLLPEGIAAFNAARNDRVQIGLNLAMGSAMASIGLTIPVIAIASIWLAGPLILGLGATQLVLLALTVVVGILTVVPGRATLMQGGVHLSIFAAFLFLAVSP